MVRTQNIQHLLFDENRDAECIKVCIPSRRMRSRIPAACVIVRSFRAVHVLRTVRPNKMESYMNKDSQLAASPIHDEHQGGEWKIENDDLRIALRIVRPWIRR